MIEVSQDKDADLYYWLNFSEYLGQRTIDSFSVDPDGALVGLGLSVVSMGVNDAQVTDNEGTAIAIGQAVGLNISGGTLYESYEVVIRFTMDSTESDDKKVKVTITD